MPLEAQNPPAAVVRNPAQQSAMLQAYLTALALQGGIRPPNAPGPSVPQQFYAPGGPFYATGFAAMPRPAAAAYPHPGYYPYPVPTSTPMAAAVQTQGNTNKKTQESEEEEQWSRETQTQQKASDYNQWLTVATCTCIFFSKLSFICKLGRLCV